MAPLVKLRQKEYTLDIMDKKATNGTLYVTTKFVKRKLGEAINNALAGKRLVVCRNGRPTAVITKPTDEEMLTYHESDKLLS